MKQQTIINNITGQQILFIRSDKDLLEMESCYPPGGNEPAPHYHPFQEELFRVISGKLTVRINDGLHEYLPGEVLQIPRGTVHSMWNSSNEKTKVNWQVSPALQTEESLRTFVGLANHGKTNHQGVPGLLQASVTLRKYSKEIRLAKPRYFLLSTIMLILSPLAYIIGYRATDQRY